ncbi:hypothetical protein [Pseudomonas sp. P9_31]|uniref:hypothetical protein n=1 Tax=Pseudomonas sp. P9_31 TaxID=3043448 RepID=UPI002A370CFA|nr:hypothetical protein [Pseudomonas sp. P9_31]WPN59149.1 hypothetical protein QMK51_05945 [Pseudomonas sp. P9_31]
MKNLTTIQVPSIAQLNESQNGTLHWCLTDFQMCRPFDTSSFLPILLDCLLIPTSVGIEMSGITIDVDLDPANIADHLIGVPGITFEFMDAFVTLPTPEAIRYICTWCDRHAEHDRDNVLLKCQALKARFEA